MTLFLVRERIEGFYNNRNTSITTKSFLLSFSLPQASLKSSLPHSPLSLLSSLTQPRSNDKPCFPWQALFSPPLRVVLGLPTLPPNRQSNQFLSGVQAGFFFLRCPCNPLCCLWHLKKALIVSGRFLEGCRTQLFCFYFPFPFFFFYYSERCAFPRGSSHPNRFSFLLSKP